jgi:hypothetical protein
MRRAVLTLASLSILLISGNASAQIPEVLRSGTHPLYSSFTMGGAINAKDSFSQFKVAEDIGYHFSGDSSGPAIAFVMQESFGESVIIFETGPQFVYDIPVKDGLGLYLSPSFMIGFLIGAPSYGDSGKGVTFQPAFKGKLLLGDRGYVFFQPIGLDIAYISWAGYGGISIRYEMLFGGGVTF